MTNIFEKNISALNIKNELLASKIVRYIPNDIPQLKQENGFYNIFYKGIYLSDKRNPLEEAKQIFSQAENSPVAIHLVYGISLGYLFQTVSVNSVGTVILYEPDLNILKIAFSLVDFSDFILKKNVYVTDNLEDVGNIIYTK